MLKIKEKIERLLKSKFIRTSRYVEWLTNIFSAIKKNGTLKVCIDFRDLNNATPKDEYHMLVAEMLVDSATGFEYLRVTLVITKSSLLKKMLQKQQLVAQEL